MKNSLLILTVALVACNTAFAQRLPAPGEKRVPRLIVATDMGFQWFEVITRFGSLKAEYPLSAYHQVGLRLSKVFSGYSPDYYFNETLEKGSFEVGVDAKYFPHGRFTGRKTGFYIGPDIRFGERKYSADEYNFLTGMTSQISYKHVTSKFLFSWGVQWHFGQHAVLDIGAPIGVEYYQINDRRYNNDNSNSSKTFVMLPTIMIGFAF